MIEVFKTDVPDQKTADSILGQLSYLMPDARVNFDLEDCDNILRIDCCDNTIEIVIPHMKKLGFYCEVLE